ncbi:hypothetical protein LguiB_007779 [Lonicera macranthoides]
MGRNRKETPRKNRELNKKPLERNKKKAILEEKMPLQMAKTEFSSPELHKELELGCKIKHKSKKCIRKCSC